LESGRRKTGFRKNSNTGDLSAFKVTQVAVMKPTMTLTITTSRLTTTVFLKS
jgi:hypothetical protein